MAKFDSSMSEKITSKILTAFFLSRVSTFSNVEEYALLLCFTKNYSRNVSRTFCFGVWMNCNRSNVFLDIHFSIVVISTSSSVHPTIITCFFILTVWQFSIVIIQTDCLFFSILYQWLNLLLSRFFFYTVLMTQFILSSYFLHAVVN